MKPSQAAALNPRSCHSMQQHQEIQQVSMPDQVDPWTVCCPTAVRKPFTPRPSQRKSFLSRANQSQLAPRIGQMGRSQQRKYFPGLHHRRSSHRATYQRASRPQPRVPSRRASAAKPLRCAQSVVGNRPKKPKNQVPLQVRKGWKLQSPQIARPNAVAPS